MHDTLYGPYLTLLLGDTKAGTLVGTDKWGNKYYENIKEDLPLRTRWVDYANRELDASQIEPGWHAWMSYMTDKAPSEDKLQQLEVRPWEVTGPRLSNQTMSRSAYRPYSTVKPKYSAWDPHAKPRDGSTPFKKNDKREGAELGSLDDRPVQPYAKDLANERLP